MLERLRNSQEWASISSGLSAPTPTPGPSSTDLNSGPATGHLVPPVPPTGLGGGSATAAAATTTNPESAPPVSNQISSLLSLLSNNLPTTTSSHSVPHGGYPEPRPEKERKPASRDPNTAQPQRKASSTPHDLRAGEPRAPPPESLPQHLRNLSFNQALPYLTRLASDPDFVKVVRKVRNFERLFFSIVTKCNHSSLFVFL